MSESETSPNGGSVNSCYNNTLAPLLLTKAAASLRGGSFNEITNHGQIKPAIKFYWFPCELKEVTEFADFAAELDRGALYITSFASQYDATGTKISVQGVVTGHAFAIVDSLSVDGVQLVRVENPWGSGSDYISDYSDDAPFWAEHPEFADKLSDSKQSKGNYWIDWTTFKKLTGKTKFIMQSPIE